MMGIEKAKKDKPENTDTMISIRKLFKQAMGTFSKMVEQLEQK